MMYTHKITFIDKVVHFQRYLFIAKWKWMHGSERNLKLLVYFSMHLFKYLTNLIDFDPDFVDSVLAF